MALKGEGSVRPPTEVEEVRVRPYAEPGQCSIGKHDSTGTEHILARVISNL